MKALKLLSDTMSQMGLEDEHCIKKELQDLIKARPATRREAGMLPTASSTARSAPSPSPTWESMSTWAGPRPGTYRDMACWISRRRGDGRVGVGTRAVQGAASLGVDNWRKSSTKLLLRDGEKLDRIG